MAQVLVDGSQSLALMPTVMATSASSCVSQGANTPLQAVNGHCLGCGYRLAWIVIRGKRDTVRGLERERRLNKVEIGS
jgi:hypothetical protein